MNAAARKSSGASLQLAMVSASLRLAVSRRQTKAPPTRRRAPLTADTTHRARGRHELRFADVMPGLFLPNHAAQPVGDVVVGSAIAQVGAEVMLGHAEQTGADFAVGGQADAVAVAAEGFADRCDDADFALPIREAPAFGGGGGIVGGHRLEVEAGLKAGKKLAAARLYKEWLEKYGEYRPTLAKELTEALEGLPGIEAPWVNPNNVHTDWK